MVYYPSSISTNFPPPIEAASFASIPGLVRRWIIYPCCPPLQPSCNEKERQAAPN